MRALFIWRRLVRVFYALVVIGAFSTPAFASPFGQGVFGANTPFGSASSISVALGGNVNLNLTSNGSAYAATGTHTVTVTSNDAVGYALYAYSPTSNTMQRTGGGDTIPASSNSTAAGLATNSWGYNASGSTTNFIGMTTNPVLVVSRPGPYTSGDTTTLTYGVLTDFTKSAGSYSVGVSYTVMGLSE